MARTTRFYGPLALLLLALVAVGCTAKSIGDACLASDECDSGLCYANLCLDPAGDEDKDGLDNATEHRLRSHPKAVDTDKDGKLDGDELGTDPDNPTDTDGDGIPDLVESLNADSDGDCLPDELDDNDEQPNGDPAKLKAIACSTKGVCTGQLALIAATCNVGKGGPATCVYKAVPGYSALEACDGLDNDCDGETDEDNTWQGLKIGGVCDGTGACGDGKVVCHKGKATCSSNPDGRSPAVSAELCNGIDDDCDGVTDEGFELGGLSVGAPCLGTGECGVGKVVCGAGKPVCSSDPGAPDSEAKVEVCNNLDDDCDGETDEGMKLGSLSIGDACTGIGACGPGTVVCSSKGKPACSSNPDGPKSAAKPETCNGKDDNCNGQTDEGITYNSQPLGAFCWGVGECGKGTVVCSVDGKPTCSSMPGAPANKDNPKTETCDGKDDDCDGQTDEGFVYQGGQVGDACIGVGACAKGVVQCNKSGGVTCSSNPDGSKAGNKFEECNNVDDDCDGVTDDGVPPTFGPKCSPKGICVGEKALPTCNAGAWSCSYPDAKGFEGPNEQTCDGKDNDCDGLVDEGLAHLWKPTPQKLTDGAPSSRKLAAWCRFDDALYLAGGQVPSSGSAVLSGELWRLDLATFAWQRLLAHPDLKRTGAALACLPAMTDGGVKTARSLWLLGGLDSAGKAADPVAIDPLTKTVGSPAWKGTVEHADVAIAVVDALSGQLWLAPRGDQKTAPGLQRMHLKAKTWIPAKDVMQPTFKPSISDLCVVADGTIYALSAPDTLGARWLEKLPSGAKKWSSLLKTGYLNTGGSLACGGKRVVHIGSSAVKAAAKWSMELDLGKGAFVKAPSIAAGWHASAAFVDSKQRVISVENGAIDRFGAGVWRHQPVAKDLAPKVLISVAPTPAPGRRWLVAASEAIAVAGYRCAGAKTCTASDHVWTAWRFDNHQFTPIFAPPYAEGIVHPKCPPIAVADVDHGRLFTWPLACPLGSFYGVRSVDLVANKLVDLASDKGLPTETFQSPMEAIGHVPSRVHILGLGKKGDVQLWLTEFKAAPVSTMIWSGPGAKGPQPSPHATLIHDEANQRLLLFQPGKSLRVHAFDLGAKPGTWGLVGEDTTISGGRVRIAGDPGMKGAQLVVAFAHNGPPAVSRTLAFGKKVSFGPGQLKLGALAGDYELVWQRNSGQALLIHGSDSSGHPISRIDQLTWACK